jgi:hypothetical protein
VRGDAEGEHLHGLLVEQPAELLLGDLGLALEEGAHLPYEEKVRTQQAVSLLVGRLGAQEQEVAGSAEGRSSIALQHSTAQHSTAQHSTAQHSTA